MTTEKRELLRLCDEVLAEWEGEFHENDGTLKPPNAEAIVARALRSILTDREGAIYTEEDVEALCEIAVAACKKRTDREGFVAVPREPTEPILRAMADHVAEAHNHFDMRVGCIPMYRAMVAAAERKG